MQPCWLDLSPKTDGTLSVTLTLTFVTVCCFTRAISRGRNRFHTSSGAEIWGRNCYRALVQHRRNFSLSPTEERNLKDPQETFISMGTDKPNIQTDGKARQADKPKKKPKRKKKFIYPSRDESNANLEGAEGKTSSEETATSQIPSVRLCCSRFKSSSKQIDCITESFERMNK